MNEFVDMPGCRICGAPSDRQSVRAEHVFGGRSDHRFFECDNCGVVHLFPIPSEEEEKIFYKKEFENFMSSRSGYERDWSDAKRHVDTNQDQVKRRWPFIERNLAPGKDLLEIGCSSGFMLMAFREYGINCYGVEPSGEFIEFLLQQGFSAYESIEDLKVNEDNHNYDLIVHFFLLEHIRDPFSFLTGTYDLLKPGGSIIMEVPCVHDPLTSIYDIPNFERFYWSIAHHYYYSYKAMKYVLDQLGFKYDIVPEQRYDLSNHIVWMTEGKPGGQGRYNDIFSNQTLSSYKNDLINNWFCDTMFVTIYKEV